MMRKFQGIPVSSGVAICNAFVMTSEGYRIAKKLIAPEAVNAEVRRLETAVAAACAETAQYRDSIGKQLGRSYAEIFEAHLLVLTDAKFISELEDAIRTQLRAAEYAVQTVLAERMEVFRSFTSAHLAERANDLADIERRIVRHLLGVRGERLDAITTPVILLATNLTPSETANLNRNLVRGFVTEQGGSGGHTAIVASALEIPAVVGVGRFLDQVVAGDTIIVDGTTGEVIICPDDATLARYRQRQEEMQNRSVALAALTGVEAVTRDGVRITLCGNIEFPFESHLCLERGADGVGLFRTEFLYLTHEENVDVSEAQHYEAYKEVAETMREHFVTIRTCDLGSDKFTNDMDEVSERNPALGLRSIRLSLRNVGVFAIQLRAILRASVIGNIRMMFPMITTLPELRAAKMILADVQEDLHEHGIPFDPHMKVGMMVEVPAAVLMLDRFVSEVDFLSIGTNDLIQYTLGVDRGNSQVSHLFHPEDPAVLRLIRQTMQTATAANVPVCLCGQMASNPLYVPLLLGLGLRELSCPPQAIQVVKEVCRSVTIEQCERIAAEVMEMETALDIRTALREHRREIFPQLAIY
ncbi:MAG: phosphoenolpyruvate--protein phosphotransferase [Thermoguttaceae bacterium]